MVFIHKDILVPLTGTVPRGRSLDKAFNPGYKAGSGLILTAGWSTIPRYLSAGCEPQMAANVQE